MREDDRVAIHEAMEQQTISIAKVSRSSKTKLLNPPVVMRLTELLSPPQAGITTTLNSRCSVLAAANSVFGRWDDTKGEDNIDFMPTILSRFDMIFIIKDQHDQQRDMVRTLRWFTLLSSFTCVAVCNDVCVFADSGSSRDERSPERSDSD